MHCEHKQLTKAGFKGNSRRFVCKDCGKNLSDEYNKLGKISDSQLLKIHNFLAEGDSYTQIRKKVKISVATITRIINELREEIYFVSKYADYSAQEIADLLIMDVRLVKRIWEYDCQLNQRG
jgi:transposase-like protein